MHTVSAILAVLIWEALTTFSSEYQYIWQRKYSFITGAYLICRYWTLASFSVTVYLAFDVCYGCQNSVTRTENENKLADFRRYGFLRSYGPVVSPGTCASDVLRWSDNARSRLCYLEQ